MALTQLESYMVGPTASTPKITSLTYPSSATAANPVGGETLTITGSGFSAGATVYVDTTSCSTTYVSATSVTFTAPAKTAGEYHLYVYNTDGTFAMKPSGYTSSSVPTWVTASGALTGAYQNAPYSTSGSATGDSIVYNVTTGSLPTGLSLNSSTGAITGTPTVVATSTFSITATDAQNQGVARSFSIAVVNAVSVDYLVVAGGGGGGLQYGGGGGAGGLLANSVTIDPGVTYSITVGAGGNANVSGSNSSISGSGFTTVTSIGGGSGTSAGTGGKGVYPGSVYLDQSRQGYDGGNAISGGGYSGAGGGGAGAIGQPPAGPTASKGGDGGIGLTSSITGTSTYYAGGGGGHGYSSDKGIGGLGGGGNGGGNPIPVAATVGTINTGGGGGGGSTDGSGGGGKAGGSGVVILRFLSSVTPAGTTGSPTITTDGSYSVYKYTASGSITI